MREDRRARKRRKDKWTNRMAMLGITMVVLSLAVVVNIRGTSLKQRDLEYQLKEETLAKQVALEEQRAEELEEYRIYVPVSYTHLLQGRSMRDYRTTDQ